MDAANVALEAADAAAYAAVEARRSTIALAQTGLDAALRDAAAGQGARVGRVVLLEEPMPTVENVNDYLRGLRVLKAAMAVISARVGRVMLQ